MFGSFSIWHWLVVLLIVVLVFGTKKLRNLGQDLGGAVKGFKDGMQEASAETKPTNTVSPSSIETQQSVAQQQTVDVEAREKKD